MVGFRDWAKSVKEEMTLIRPPVSINFDYDFHKFLVNYEELGAEIVDYTKENIPKWNAIKDNGRGLKFEVKAGEKKYVRIPVTYGNNSVCVQFILYVKGTAKLRLYGGWMGQDPIKEVTDGWTQIIGRTDVNGIVLEVSSDQGATVYISNIAIYSTFQLNAEILEINSYIGQNIESGKTYNYYIAFPVGSKSVMQLVFSCAGDGVNPINVDVILGTVDGYRVISTVSRTASSFHAYSVIVPVQLGNYAKIAFTQFWLRVTGSGKFGGYILKRYNVTEFIKRYNGLRTASASETSTTPVLYTLIDNYGRGNYYKQLKADITVPTTGGSVELIINGKTVGTYTSSTTVDLSWFDEPIWKIQAKIAGDGTNPSSVTVSGHEFLGPYLVSR